MERAASDEATVDWGLLSVADVVNTAADVAAGDGDDAHSSSKVPPAALPEAIAQLVPYTTGLLEDHAASLLDVLSAEWLSKSSSLEALFSSRTALLERSLVRGEADTADSANSCGVATVTLGAEGVADDNILAPLAALWGSVKLSSADRCVAVLSVVGNKLLAAPRSVLRSNGRAILCCLEQIVSCFPSPDAVMQFHVLQLRVALRCEDLGLLTKALDAPHALEPYPIVIPEDLELRGSTAREVADASTKFRRQCPLAASLWGAGKYSFHFGPKTLSVSSARAVVHYTAKGLLETRLRKAKECSAEDSILSVLHVDSAAGRVLSGRAMPHGASGYNHKICVVFHEYAEHSSGVMSLLWTASVVMEGLPSASSKRNVLLAANGTHVFCLCIVEAPRVGSSVSLIARISRRDLVEHSTLPQASLPLAVRDVYELRRITQSKSSDRHFLFTKNNPITAGCFRLKSKTRTFTVEMWVFPCSAEAQSIFSHGDKSTEEILLEIVPTDAGAQWRAGCRTPMLGASFVSHEVQGKGDLCRRWWHIVFTFSGAHWALWVDGRKAGSAPALTSPSPVAESTCTLGKGFSGCLREVRVWDYARPEAEIIRDGHRTLDGSEFLLEAYFPLDEQEGCIITDHSHNKGHAILPAGSESSWVAADLCPVGPRQPKPTADISPPALLRTSTGDGRLACSTTSIVLAIPQPENATAFLEYDTENFLRCGDTLLTGFPVKSTLAGVAYSEETIRCFRLQEGDEKRVHFWDVRPSSSPPVVHGPFPTLWACTSHALRALGRVARRFLQQSSTPLERHDVERIIGDAPSVIAALAHVALLSYELNDDSCAAVCALLAANIAHWSKRDAKITANVVQEPLPDAQLLLSRAKAIEAPPVVAGIKVGAGGSSLTRAIIEFLSFSRAPLLDDVVGVLLTEKAALAFVIKCCGRIRQSKTESMLFQACISYFGSSGRCQSLIQQRSVDRLFPLSAALLAEAQMQFVLSQKDASAEAIGDRVSVTATLETLQEVLFAAAAKPSPSLAQVKPELPTGPPVVATYCLQLLKSCEKAAVHVLTVVRKDTTKKSSSVSALQASFVGALLPSLLVVLPLFSSAVLAGLMTGICSLRDSLMAVRDAVASRRDNLPWLSEIVTAMTYTLGSVSCALTRSHDVQASAEDEARIAHGVLRGGLHRQSSPRDAPIRSLLLGVGPLAKVLAEIQQSNPLRSAAASDATAVLERSVFAAFCSMLLPTPVLLNPTRDEVALMYRHVRNLWPWVQSKRQEDPKFGELLEQRAAFLCRFEPCSASAFRESITAAAVTTPHSSRGSTNKKWRKMFQNWKAVRHLKSMLAVLSNRQTVGSSNEAVEDAELVVRFLQTSSDSTNEMLERVLAMKTAKAQFRLTGLVCLRQLMSEVHARQGDLPAVNQPLVVKALAGWHYAHGIHGCSSEALVRVRGAFLQLFTDVVMHLKTAKSRPAKRHWAEIFLCLASNPWDGADMVQCKLQVPRLVLELSNLGSSSPAGGSAVAPLLQLTRCSTSLFLDATGSLIRSVGARGTCVAPVVWRKPASTEGESYFYFEVSIVDMGSAGSVSVGIGPPEYSVSRPPGWDAGSFALHSEDGALFAESSTSRQTSVVVGQGDVIGCCWDCSTREVFWTRNGRHVNVAVETTREEFSPTVGLDGKCTVRVNLGLSPFLFSHRSRKGQQRSLSDQAWTTFQIISLRSALYVSASSAKGPLTQESCRVANECYEVICGALRALDVASTSNSKSLESLCAVTTIMSRAIRGTNSLRVPSGLLNWAAETVRCLLVAAGGPLPLSSSRISLLTCLFHTVAILVAAEADDLCNKLLDLLFLSSSDNADAPLDSGNDNVLHASIAFLHRICMDNSHAAHDLLMRRLLATLREDHSSHLPSDKRKGLIHALSIISSQGTIPVAGDVVTLRRHKQVLQGTIVSLSIPDEVADVVLMQPVSCTPTTLPLRCVCVDSTLRSQFPSPRCPSHKEVVEAVLALARQLPPSQTSLCTSFEAALFDTLLLRCMWRCVQVYPEHSAAVAMAVAPTLASATTLWLDKPIGTLLDEEAVGLRILREQRKTFAGSLFGSPAALDATSFPADSNGSGGVSSAVDDARTRMAEELSMRGFSVEMCLIALEETHYDRAAAVRLLTEHHDDLLSVMRHNERSSSSGDTPRENAGEGDGGSGDEDEELSEDGEDDDDDDDNEDEDENDDENENDNEDDNDDEDDDETDTLDKESIHSTNSAPFHEGLRFRGGVVKVASDVSVGPQFTIDLWIRPQNITEPQIIFVQQGPAADSVLFLRIADSKLYFGWGSLFVSTRGICETPLSDGDPSRWTRVSCVQDCADLFLFKNGLLRDTTVSAVAESLLSTELVIGGSPDTDSLPFTGDVKDVRIFDAALTHDAVESLFSLSLTPTSAASNSHLVAHLRCDEGQFPIENVSTSPNSLAVSVTVHGQVTWLPAKGDGSDAANITQNEIDFTTQRDGDDLFTLDLSQEQRELGTIWKGLKSLSCDELGIRLMAGQADIHVHLAVRIVLHAVTVASPAVELSAIATPEQFRRAVRLASSSTEDDVLEMMTDLAVHLAEMPATRSCGLLREMVSEFVAIARTPQKILVFESPHPCKSLAEPPREVSVAGASNYDLFFDQRCSTGTMLFTVYTDHTLSNVVAQFAGPALSSMRLATNKFFFDVRIDGIGPQWGYKLSVVADAHRQLHAVRLLKCAIRCVTSLREVADGNVIEGLAACAVANTGKTRRIALSCLSDLVVANPSIVRPMIVASGLLEVRRMMERQYRREVGLHLHSRFVQVSAEFFIALKDADLCTASMALVPSGGPAPGDGHAVNDFAHRRAQQKLLYSSKARDGKERVQLEKLRFPENIRIEANPDRSVAAWSERTGASCLASVVLYHGCWYFEAKMLATADVAVGVLASNYDRRDPAGAERQTWFYNGKKAFDAGNSQRPFRAWRSKDVVGVVINVDARELRFFVNGCETDVVVSFAAREDGGEDAASAARPPGSSRAQTEATTGFYPFFLLAADEGIVVNFGATHFEFEIPANCLPLDPSNLALGTLIPFNQVRAFQDVCASLLAGLDVAPVPPFFSDESDPFDEVIAARQGPPHVSLTAHPNISINLMEARCTGNAFSTVRGNCSVTKGRWYFEVTLLTQGLMQIGWLEADADIGATVGDTRTSWSVDLFRRLRWHNERCQPLTSVRRWTCGDVVGCGIDLDQGTMLFTFNGRSLTDVLGNECFFSDIHPGRPLCPAVSLRPGNACLFNFGSAAFKFKPDFYSALGVPDTWNERIDTYYATQGPALAAKRVALLRKTCVDYPRAFLRPPTALEQLVREIEKCCAESGKSYQQLPDDTVATLLSAVPSGWTAELSAKHFDLLKNFARLAQTAIPLCSVDLRDLNRATSLIRVACPFLFSSVRETLVNLMLKETNCRSEHFRLTVNRVKARSPNQEHPLSSSIFGQTHELLCDQHPRLFKTSKRFWSVLFLGEGAEDVGGPFREHLSEMCNELMSDRLPLFVRTANNVHNAGTHREALVPAAGMQSELHLSMFNFVGRLMGGAMRSNEPLSLFFPPLIWKRLAHIPVDDTDIDGVDKMCLQCIREFRSMAETGGPESKEMFDETFESEMFVTALSDGTIVDLIPNGSSIKVTFDQSAVYADALAQARLMEAAQQVEAMREGLLSVIPELALALLTADELELRVCGKADYTVAELREGASFEGLTSEDRRVGFLWTALEDATPLQRRLFLRFVSGRERMPVKLRILPMVTQGDPNSVLPRAATCFFAIEIPDYSTPEVMKEKLYYSIENCLDIDTDFRARDTDESDRPQLLVGLEDGRQDDAEGGTTAPE